MSITSHDAVVKRLLILSIAAFAFILNFIPTQSALAASFVVNTTSDTNDGTCNTTHCSLREAIIAANANAGADTISFAIGTGVQTIKPTSLLPNITGGVTIDGTTQPGFTNAPLIEIDGTNAGNQNGLAFYRGSSNSSVRGLIINRFKFAAIIIESANDIRITGNYLGTDVTGTVAAGLGQSATASITISNSSNITIGGTSTSDRNIISGGNGHGIGIFDGGGIVIQGNYIGTDVTGTVPLGNGSSGIYIWGGYNTTGVNIGGSAPGAGNIIRNNGLQGVSVGTSNNPIHVRGNQISNNVGLGIDLYPDGVNTNDAGDVDTKWNSGQNFPVITSALHYGATTKIAGTLNSTASATFQLDFYSQAACDASGYGEGETYLGSTSVTTNASGNAVFTFDASSVAVGQIITATATNAANETSEFSACTAVAQTAMVEFSSNGFTTPDEAGTTYDIAAVVTTSDGNPLVNTLTVDVSDLGTGTAETSDYSFSTTTLTFAAGAATDSNQNAMIAVVSDTDDEADETVDLRLGNLRGTNASLGSQTDYTLTITNDDQSATVQFSSTGFITSDESNTDYNIDVVVTTSDGQPLVNAITVDVSNLGTGSATDIADYNVSTTQLTFATSTPSGSTQAASVTVITDSLDETDETVDFGLGNLTGINASLVLQTVYTLTITDDDGVGVIVTPQRLRIRTGETKTYTVVLNSQPTADVIIRLREPQHCSARQRILTFTTANWDTPQTVRVRARNVAGVRCVIRHTATGGGYDGVVIDRVRVTIP
jgi:CSLREA domain-containing protein